MVRLLVDLLELVVHVLFLAEVLGNGDAANDLLDVGVDARQRALGTPRGAPRDGAEAKRDQHDEGHDHKGQQGQCRLLTTITPAMRKKSSTWLSRLSVSVTTVAKSSVSEVTRVTILPL